MASFLTCILFTLSFTFLTPFLTLNGQKSSENYSAIRVEDQVNKMSHLHFYLHDMISGKNPSAITVAGKISTFGDTVICDDSLTEGPDPGSKIVGRAQGMYTVSSQDDTSVITVIVFWFNVGEYNYSSLSILGRSPFLEKVREMPVVGGSGIFRLARGYALAKTEKFNATTGNAVVEYDVQVMHH